MREEPWEQSREPHPVQALGESDSVATTGALFLVERTRGPRWDDGRTMELQEEWAEHAEFMTRLEQSGFVMLGGPITGTRDVMLVVRARDEPEIRSRLSADPWSESQRLVVRDVKPWTLRLGKLSS